MDLDRELMPLVSGRRELVAWLVLGFVVTFLVTRFVTHAIRSGRGPFRDASIGGVHVHHEVYGIFLLLGTGTVEFTYRPDGPGGMLLAVLFGAGAALTLDEFALWLHLEDVYWSREGRSSVDAVLIALVVGVLLLIGANPLDADDAPNEPAIALTLLVNLVLALVAVLKGRVLLGVVGVFVPLVALVAALRLARPASPWARRRYPPGSSSAERSLRRFPPGRHTHWDGVVDLFAAVPPRTAPPAPAPRPSVGG
ncbi:MAG TPA: hypothetical protein VJ352_02630 [Geodermatophilus sp.]|nr:hypothetical protein [Geodermatophilus sp.]